MRKRNLRFAMLAGLAAAALHGCGPPWAPPSAPAVACPQISEAEFHAAVKAGAASARAVISPGGMVSMEAGPGVKHCATYQSSLRPCRRPDDFVIRYALADGTVSHVRVPAGAQYRFRVQAEPTTCEIVRQSQAG